ncbi:hypothetical protein [Syntrophus gentianae]|uniref:hypothetical protein n=1 Tax=Syntrophus gentianae TaxID=43775 RepID=UPI000B82E498|nr:hypothetical protein [Syntrophus gentianae]
MKEWIILKDTAPYNDDTEIKNGSDHSTASQGMTVSNSTPHDQGAILDAILRETIQDIQAGDRWKTTPEVMEIESAIHETYQGVLKGTRSISEFRTLCNQWRIVGSR